MTKKIVLAYSGGLDTSVILKWLQEKYQCPVVTFTADLGQGEELSPVRGKAESLGVKEVFIEQESPDFTKEVEEIKTTSLNKSKLKPQAKKANLDILKWAKRNTKKPIVAIGGINDLNYEKIIECGAKYIAISSFIWDNPNLKPELAIREFK